jgi:hypothetical protein
VAHIWFPSFVNFIAWHPSPFLDDWKAPGETVSSSTGNTGSNNVLILIDSNSIKTVKIIGTKWVLRLNCRRANFARNPSS